MLAHQANCRNLTRPVQNACRGCLRTSHHRPWAHPQALGCHPLVARRLDLARCECASWSPSPCPAMRAQPCWPGAALPLVCLLSHLPVPFAAPAAASHDGKCTLRCCRATAPCLSPSQRIRHCVAGIPPPAAARLWHAPRRDAHASAWHATSAHGAPNTSTRCPATRDAHGHGGNDAAHAKRAPTPRTGSASSRRPSPCGHCPGCSRASRVHPAALTRRPRRAGRPPRRGHPRHPRVLRNTRGGHTPPGHRPRIPCGRR
jgi:hypothetical protein